jgi:hypothetical protein
LGLLHNFTLTDIAASIAAVCLFPLFVLVPGYAVAWLLDLFGFRRRTWLFRATLSVPLSIAIAPILSSQAMRTFKAATGPDRLQAARALGAARDTDLAAFEQQALVD